MKSSYRAVVIGGGVVGASVLYHLSKFGWPDVALIERAELTAGSTWHAAAGFHALNGDPNVAALQDYTIALYRTLEEESGQSCGLHMTGGVNLATTQARWEWAKAAASTFKAMGIETSRLMGPEEIREITGGVIRTDDIIGGLYDSNEGYLDPNGTTIAYAKAAQNRGAEIILRNRVLELNQRGDGTWDVVTELGTIHTEHVINAAGLWAKQVGHMVGLDLPVTPMEHHYLITETVEGLKALSGEMPMVIDLDAATYTRQERDGLLLGVYEGRYKHWNMDGAPWDYGMELIPEDIDRIGEQLALGFDRFPELATTGIKRWVNGAFTFAPDGNPLVGPAGPRGYWLACGVMAGFSQGGGVGKALAEWIIHGETEQDVFGMDIARFGQHQSNKEYLRQTTGQFYARRMAMTFPNEQLPAGRPLRTAPAYGEMTAAGARWGQSWGLEVPLYFAPEGFAEPGTMRRSTAFPLVAEECHATQNAAGLLDISGFSRYRISGTGAAAFLDRLLACKLPKAGQIKLAPMLSESGKLKGDMTCFNWGNGEYWLMGSYYLREFHMRWFNAHATGDVWIEDVSDAYAGFSVSGPKARDIIARIAETKLDGLTMMRCQTLDLGLHRVRAGRLSLSGEQAFELHCHTSEHAQLRGMLLEAGADEGLREIGFAAMLSMRLEKGIGIWSAEFTQGYTPAMTRLDHWIDWDKGDFIGRNSAKNAADPVQILTMLEVDAGDADASGFEPVWQDDTRVGITTSGGFGHRTGRSFALALIDTALSEPGTALHIDVVGERRAATVCEMSPYDPSGAKMRA